MHIEDDAQVLVATPVHDPVNQAKSLCAVVPAHIILVGEEFVMERYANGVHARLGNVMNVGLGDIVLLELVPEVGRKLLARQFTKHLVDETIGRSFAETEHIPLGIDPVA